MGIIQNIYEKVTYINEQGKSIEIGYSFPYFFQSLSGTDGTENEIVKGKSPYQDGITVISEKLKDRPLILVGLIKGQSKEELQRYRSELFKVFQPKLEGQLIYEYGTTVKEIKCRVETAPKFSKEKIWKKQRFLISFIAPNPFWKDTFTLGEEIISWLGGVSFPFSFPISFATKGETKKNIINSGDVETPLEITFRGPASNPKITNLLTGEFIRVKQNLTADDTLVINTEFGNKKVEIIDKDGSKVNAFNYIDLNSTFFQLRVGDNVLEYSSDNNVDPASVSIKYRNRYLGV